MTDRMDRRGALRRLAHAGAILGGSGLVAALGRLSPGRVRADTRPRSLTDRRVAEDPLRPSGVIVRGGETKVRVRAAVDRLGGMSRFVRRGETVVVKPNMAWDSTPERGANTDPEVVAAVVTLCREAGAGRVIVAEVPIHQADRVAARSGIAEAARQAGADVIIPPRASFTTVALEGAILDEWEVFDPVLGADRLVNVPVAKDHGLSRLSCGMKNLYGFLGGTRARLHQRIHVAITDLAAAFLPTLTVVDATRVMMRGGPQGGRLEDVKPVGAVAAGTDPVALDAWGATLLGVNPAEIPHLTHAEGRGLGSASPDGLEEIRAGV